MKQDGITPWSMYRHMKLQSRGEHQMIHSRRPTHTRRDFLETTAGAGLLISLGDLGAFLPLSSVAAANTQVTHEIVRLSADIEPIVRLIEQIPRAKCFEMMVEQLRRGLPYRQFLAALFLAGIRNVDSQPPGFGFHCVFVIHSAHQLSLNARIDERLLPLFWALDYFKHVQDWGGQERLLPSLRGQLPASDLAENEFRAAMDDWDDQRAERAVVAMIRCRGAHEVIEEVWRYAARDYRSIGHQAIFGANSWRTLQTIGWQHAEPTLRSLVQGLVAYGKTKRWNGYAFDDQCYLANLSRVRQATKKLPADWADAHADAAIADELLPLIRAGNTEEACQFAVDRLVRGTAKASSLWDTVHLAAGELIMRQPGIGAVHAVTSANALHYIFRMSRRLETRLLVLLQGIGWMNQFRHFMAADSEGLRDVNILELTGSDKTAEPKVAVEEILSLVSSNADEAAGKAYRYAQQHPEPALFTQAARRLVFLKSTDAHDYKYPAAIFEDYRHVDARWRPHMLAAATYHLRGSTLPDSALMKRAQEAVRSL